MIFLGSRDGRKMLEQGFSCKKREMDTELEEGEACSYQDHDSSIDPDVALSYLDEKLQNVLGHFKKDFEGVVSAESLGAKFGIYGSFLPAHRRSPVWCHSRSPPRVQSHIIPQSPNILQPEVGHQNSLAPANGSYSIRQGSASDGSTSSYAYKPPPQNDLCRQHAGTQSIRPLEESTPKSEVRDHKTLKVRIKVGSDSLSVKQNAEIYSGLGLDGSPTSSLNDSPMESEGLSCRLSLDAFESPTRILQMMTFSPPFGGCLSPLSDDLMCLCERPKYLQDILTQPSSKAKPDYSVIEHPPNSVKYENKVFGENNMMLIEKKGLFLQEKSDGKDSTIGSLFHLRESDIDAVSCEELASNALKLPLSSAYNNVKGSPRAAQKERVFSDALKREPIESISVHDSLSDKPSEKATSAAIFLHSKSAEVGNDTATDLENLGDGKGETADCTTKVGTGLNFIKASNIGTKGPVYQGTDKSTSCDDGTVLPCGKEQFPSGDEKRPKNSQAHNFGSIKIAVEVNHDSAQVLTDTKYSETCNYAYIMKLQNESRKGRGQYADFFGETNEEETDIMDSPDLPSGETLKVFKVADNGALANEKTSRERTNSLKTRNVMTPGPKVRGYSNGASLQENGQPLAEPTPISVDGNDHWVCCDKCQKWRLFPPGSKSDDLPDKCDKWDCSMMTWLSDMNSCSSSEKETNNFHAPPPGMTSAYMLNSVVPINGIITSKVRRTSKSSSLQDSPKKLPSSMKKKQQSAQKTLKEAKESFLVNGVDLQQLKSSDICLETGEHNKIEKQITDCYFDGGHAKIPNTKSRRESNQEFPSASKKCKTGSMQSGGNDGATAHYQSIEVLGVSSGYALGDGTARKVRVFNSQNSKDDMGGSGITPDFLNQTKFQVGALPAVGSVHVRKSCSRTKKIKGDPASSTPSSGKLMDDSEKSSRKRHRISNSEGKESSASKRNGKAEKKTNYISQCKYSKESLQKDLSCVNPVVAATSSSSKISGSLKVKGKFQDFTGSPVESVSSSPFKIPNSEKLASGCKVVVMNDTVQAPAKLATSSPKRCFAADYEGSGDQSGAIRNGIIPISTVSGSLSTSMIDMENKSKGGLPLTNGNDCVDNLNLDSRYPSQAQALHRYVNETAKGEVHIDGNMSKSGKSCKESPSLSQDKNQTFKSKSGKGNVKMSESYENSQGHTSIYEERERERKVRVDEKCGSNADKIENCALFQDKEISLSKSEARKEHDERRSFKKFDVNTKDVVPISANEKSRDIPCSNGEKKEMSNTMQPCEGNKASTSASDAHPDGLSRELRHKTKTDNQNGSHISSKHPIFNGHRNKNQDTPSPLRRDASSQAASNAIKEATNLKHLADRLKSSGSTESTAMYFEAALKFLHGASLLESGKTENLKPADINQSMQIYSSTAKLCQFCAHEFERTKDMATAALAYKCVEVAYLRVIYSLHNTANRDRHELQTALQMVPPGESPSSSASDIDNLNNTVNGDKAGQARSGGSPQLAANLVIAAKNRPNFSRLLNYAQDVNFAMEASRKSRIAFAAANVSMGQADLKRGITSIKTALDFNFHDVDGLLRLVRVAKEAISR